MEEDAEKSLPDQNPTDTLLDYNQCGIPLLEIVSEPDLRSGAQASHLCRKSVNFLGSTTIFVGTGLNLRRRRG